MEIAVNIPNKRTIAAIKRKIEAEAAKVAKSRDAIRSLRRDMEAYDEAWDDAACALEEAADRISELL